MKECICENPNTKFLSSGRGTDGKTSQRDSVKLCMNCGDLIVFSEINNEFQYIRISIWTKENLEALMKNVNDVRKSEGENPLIITEFSIPELAKMLDEAKTEKAKTIIPKFQKGQLVHRSGYSNYSGEIVEIDIEIQDDGEPHITYTIEDVGHAWESELELSNGKYYFDY